MDDSFEITDEENQYLKWRSTAQREGFLYKFAMAYYKNNASNLYNITVEDEDRLIPVFVDGDWFRRVEPDTPITRYDDSMLSEYDIEYIRKIAKSIAYEEGKQSGILSDFLWNNKTYGVDATSTDALKFGLRLTDYYTVREQSARLTEEIFESAYENGFDPRMSYGEMSEKISKFEVPYRDTYYRDFEHMTKFDDGPRLSARSTIVVLNTGDGYAIPFEKRGAGVSESPFWWNPVPGGVFQPLRESESRPSMRDDTVHSVAEKLTPTHDSRQVRSYLNKILKTDKAHLEYITTGIDSINGYVQFYNLLVINDPMFYERFLRNEKSSWQAQDTALIHIDNNERMKQLLSPRVLNPYNVLGLSEALIRIKNNYDSIDVPIHITRRYTR